MLIRFTVRIRSKLIDKKSLRKAEAEEDLVSEELSAIFL